MFKLSSLLFLLLTAVIALHSSDYLFFLEAQGVAAFSVGERKLQLYSHSVQDSMQKPSLGFDLIKRFHKNGRDFMIFYLQPRIAFNDGGKPLVELQLYNGYLKFKLVRFDFWAGHSRSAFGLASSFDTHAHILQPLAMDGFYPERDWGGGVIVVGSRTEWQASLTTGSGMKLELDGGWVLATQLVMGSLARDNSQAGISAAIGRRKFHEIHFEEKLHEELSQFAMIGFHFSFSINNFEHRGEIVHLQRPDSGRSALFWRTSLSVLREGVLKFEIQPVIIRDAGRYFIKFGLGTTFLATPEIALRQAFLYDSTSGDFRIVVQFYLYKSIGF